MKQQAYEIPPKWIEMLSVNAETLDRHDVMLFMQYHPLMLAITGKPFLDALSRGFEYVFDDAPPEAKERFAKVADSATQPVIRVFKLALSYGAAGIGIVVSGEDASKPIDTGWFSQNLENGFSFNTFDSLVTAGSFITDLDPNSTEFQKVIDFSVRGKRYHFSRCKAVFNPLEDPNYLQYESSAYGFVSASILKRALPALQQYLRLRIAETLLTKKVASFVIKQDVKQSVYEKISETINSFKRSKVEDLTGGDAITIGIDDSIESFDLANSSQTINALDELNMNSLASSTGWQASYLKHSMLSTGFADGSNDAAQIDKMLYSVQRFTKELFEWIDDILFYIAWTDGFIDEIANQSPDLYRGKTRNQIRQLWRTGYERKFNPPTAEQPKDKAAANGDFLEALTKAVSLIMQTAGNPTLTEAVVNEIDAANIFTQGFGERIDPESLQQPQQQGFNFGQGGGGLEMDG